MVDSLHVAFRPLPLALTLGALVALPQALAWIDQDFYILMATRILIYGLIATSLNLLIGYGGMISFGHAAFVGAGAYAVAVLMQAGVVSAWLAWPLAALTGAALALLIGWFSLRTTGVYFIMITLAFAQMAYYAIISLRLFGGDDGLNLPRRSEFGLGIDAKSDVVFYYLALAMLAAVLCLFLRLINAPLGRALQGIRDNETRMAAIGFPTLRIKLLCFTAAGAAAGLGGALLANLNGLVSPNLMHWTQSGSLMIMVILGGSGHPLGGVIGACVLVALEEILREHTIHWQFGVGAALLVIVLFAERGLAGLIGRRP